MLEGVVRKIHLFRLSPQEKRAVYDEVRENYQIQPGYLLLIMAACLIALLGLLTNSVAVVIGAMLISPLMNPFLSAALALTIGDWILGRLALRTILLSVALVLLTCIIALTISPLKDATPEIISRTRPNLMDLLVAFFAGLAGSYTLLVRKGLSTIPGVAIATAVMPPLCVTAFGLYHRSWEIAAGSFFLFLTNLVAVIVSAAIMFTLAKFRTSDEYAESSKLGPHGRLLVSVLILFVLSMPLLYSLVKAARQSRERRTIEVELRKGLERVPQASVEKGWQMEQDKDGRLILNVVLRTPELLNPAEVTRAERMLQKYLRRPVALQLAQIRMRSAGVRESITSALAPAIAPISAVAIPPAPTPASNVENLNDWIVPKLKEVETLLGKKVQEYHLILSGQGKPPLLSLVVKTDDPSIEMNAKAVERLLRKQWQESGINVKESDTILKLYLVPAGSPYAKVIFAPGNITVSKESNKLVERYVQFWKISPLLQPVLMNPASVSNHWFELKRRRAVQAALASYGMSGSQNIHIEKSNLLQENEFGLDFRFQVTDPFASH